MSILALLVCILCLAINLRKKQEKLLNPAVLFFGLWTIIMLASALNLYGINAPSGEAYFLLILMFIFFFIGNYYWTYIRKNRRTEAKNDNLAEKTSENSQNQFRLRKRLYWFLLILFFFFAAIDVFLMIKYYLEGTPMWQIRNWSLEPFGSSNPILDRRSFVEEIIRTVIVSPLNIIVPPLSAYIFFTSKVKREKIAFLGSSLAFLLVSTLAGGGGRLGVVYYVIAFALMFVYHNKHMELKQLFGKYKKYVLIVLAVGLGALLFYTAIRSGIGRFIEITYKYFALPPTLLSEWLGQIKTEPHTYGLLTFFGLHSYLFRGLGTIGLGGLIPSLYYRAYSHIINAEQFIEVGYGRSNAFVTPIYYFYIDGGIPFVCIASFAFGAAVASIYKKTLKKFNLRSFVIYSLIIYAVVVSFMRIQTCIPSFIISIVFVYLLTRRIGVVSTHTHTHTHTHRKARAASRKKRPQ